MLVGREFFDGVIAMSGDWGSTWTTTSFPGYALSDVASWNGPSDVSYYVTVAVTGDVFYTNNSGLNWYYAPNPVSAILYGVAIGANGQAFAVGSSGAVYTSSNASYFAEWSDISLNFTSPPQLNGVSSLDGVVGKFCLCSSFKYHINFYLSSICCWKCWKDV